jgi:dTDP-4-dehydrorhamnose reductase
MNRQRSFRPMTRKILIVGADGLIGRALFEAAAARGFGVTGTTRRRDRPHLLHCNLEDPALHDLALPAADTAFFCAALPGFAECRNDTVRARQINVTAPRLLAEKLVAQGTHVVTLSSSSVFDWSQPHVAADKPPCPASVYGKLKAENEAAFLAFGEAATVVRFAKVLTPESRLFAGWIDALRNRRTIAAFSDLRMAPVALDDAVRLLLALAAGETSGIYQYSASRDISYLDAARHLAAALGAPPSLVEEACAAESGIPPEEITTFSSMDSSRAERLLGTPAPDPFATLDRLYDLPAAHRPAGVGHAS